MNPNSQHVLNIELILTRECNFRCQYCYEKHLDYNRLHMNENIIHSVFQYISEYHKANPNAEILINFWGGEPSLAIDIIEKITNYYLNIPWVRFLIFTNGYTNQDRLFEIVQKCNSEQMNKFVVQISYDFYGQYARVLSGNISTKETVLKTIHNALTENIPFWLKSTISLLDLQHIDLFYKEFETMYLKYGDRICLTLTPDTTAFWCDENDDYFDQKHLPIFANKMMLITKSLYQHLKNGRLIYKKFNWFSDEILNKRSLCSAGNDYFCVDFDGSVFPCHGVAFLSEKTKKKFQLGNILQKSEFGNFKLPFDVFQEPEKCKKCYACVCFRCNAHALLNTPLDFTPESGWTNHGRNEMYCSVMKTISKYVYVFNKLKEKG